MKVEQASWNVIVIKSNPNAEEENWDSFRCELWCEASQLLEDSHTFDLAEIVRNQPPWIQIVQQVIYNVIIGLKGLSKSHVTSKEKKRNDKDLTEIQAILVAGNVKFTAYSLFSGRNSEASKLQN